MTTVAKDARPVKPRPRKPLPPVSGKCRWLIEPIPVADFETGVLSINGVEYTVTVGPERAGARLTKAGTTTVYHVDLVGGGCDCADSQYREERQSQGGCKHRKALVAALAALPRQKHHACNHCQCHVEGPGLCDRCRAVEEEHAGYHEACEMEAAGLIDGPADADW